MSSLGNQNGFTLCGFHIRREGLLSSSPGRLCNKWRPARRHWQTDFVQVARGQENFPLTFSESSKEKPLAATGKLSRNSPRPQPLHPGARRERAKLPPASHPLGSSDTTHAALFLRAAGPVLERERPGPAAAGTAPSTQQRFCSNEHSPAHAAKESRHVRARLRPTGKAQPGRKKSIYSGTRISALNPSPS